MIGSLLTWRLLKITREYQLIPMNGSNGMTRMSIGWAAGGDDGRAPPVFRNRRHRPRGGGAWVAWRHDVEGARGDVGRGGLRDGRGSGGRRGSRRDRRPLGVVREPVVLPDWGPGLLHAGGRQGRAA